VRACWKGDMNIDRWKDGMEVRLGGQGSRGVGGAGCGRGCGRGKGRVLDKCMGSGCCKGFVR